MKYEKAWREIIPQMIQAAYENAEKHFLRNRNPLGIAFTYFRGVTPEMFLELDDIMLSNSVYYNGNYKFDAKTTYKIVISVDYKDTCPWSRLWHFEPVTE